MATRAAAALLAFLMVAGIAAADERAVAGEAGGDALTIASDGQTTAVVLVSPESGGETRPWERRAAEDLAKYIGLMSGAAPRVAAEAAEIEAATAGEAPLLIVGELALQMKPELREALAKAAKPEPTLRADAVVLRREGNRVYIAGNNDDGHYHAVAELLHRWGCRWYMPTEFGECVPRHGELAVGELDYAYGSPFEVRGYWISWNGSNEGAPEFRRRNFMNDVMVSGGHALGHYVEELVPEGKTAFNVPIAEDRTVEAVAAKVEEQFAAGKDFSLGMDDGIYESDSPLDAELRANLFDKYFLTHSLTDNFMVFYNKVSEILLQRHPNSTSKIGFLAYSNITIPPQRDIIAAKPLVASLAPIDIDPIHSMDDPRSPPKEEYREIMYRWAHVMQGRVFIYDYDQGMLVWRDIPNPVIQAFPTDVKHYAEAGILGVNTESRNAIATTFLNLHVRGQLLWRPDADVDALLEEFYPKFYGPAAEAMSEYWGAIYNAWADTIVTEHEHFVIPAIYTPELVSALRGHLETAEAAMKEAETKWGMLPDDWERMQERMKFTRLSFNLIDQYTQAWRAAATEGDYAQAVAMGERAAATRMELARMNPTFTTRIDPQGPVPETPEGGPAWMLGEIEQYRKLGQLVDGTRGTLITKLPVEWAYHRDPHDTGLPRGWGYRSADLTYWNEHGEQYLDPAKRKDYPTTQWEMLRTDLYAQAQGVLHPDWHSFTGYHWYKTEVELTAEQAQGNVRLMFPGIFNEGWLYVNGSLIEHRPQKPMWWINDYAFEWDADVSGKLKEGTNEITVRLHNPHHFGGMFRRPFLYRAPAQ